MFDFGFRPWTDVIGDVGSQVKEQINRYQQRRFQEQMLAKQDQMRQQDVMRADQQDARDWGRKLSLIGDERAYKEQQMNAPVDQDLAGFVRDLLAGNGGKPTPVALGTPTEPNSDFIGPFGAAMGAGVRGYEDSPTEMMKTVQVDVPGPRSMSQREYDNAMQAAPFFKAMHGTGGGSNLTFEERMALQNGLYDRKEGLQGGAETGKNYRAGMVQGGANKRLDKTLASRESEGGKNRENRIDVALINQQTRQMISEMNKIPGTADREKFLVSEINNASTALARLETSDPSIINSPEYAKAHAAHEARMGTLQKALDDLRVKGIPPAKSGSTSRKTESKVQPVSPGGITPPAAKKTVTFKDRSGKEFTRNLSDAEIETLKSRGIQYTIK